MIMEGSSAELIYYGESERNQSNLFFAANVL